MSYLDYLHKYTTVEVQIELIRRIIKTLLREEIKNLIKEKKNQIVKRKKEPGENQKGRRKMLNQQEEEEIKKKIIRATFLWKSIADRIKNRITSEAMEKRAVTTSWILYKNYHKQSLVNF